MVNVDLAFNDVALAADVVGTRIVIPHLTGKQVEAVSATALVHFDGFDDPFEYRGRARSDTFAYEFRWTPRQHAQLVAFMALWHASRTAPDSTLQIRTRIGSTPGLNPVEFVSIAALPMTFEAAGFVGVSFQARRVHRTIGV